MAQNREETWWGGKGWIRKKTCIKQSDHRERRKRLKRRRPKMRERMQNAKEKKNQSFVMMNVRLHMNVRHLLKKQVLGGKSRVELQQQRIKRRRETQRALKKGEKLLKVKPIPATRRIGLKKSLRRIVACD